MGKENKKNRGRENENAQQFPNQPPTANQPCTKSKKKKKKKKKANLSVYVFRKSDAQPIKGVKVEISGPQKKSGKTKKDGWVHFKKIKDGQYNIVVEKDPYGDETGSGNAPEGGTGTARIQLEMPRIVSVEFLDGADDKEVSSDEYQYVNLPKEDKWVDPRWIDNKDRLGPKPRIKVKFNKQRSFNFKVKYVPDPDNVEYSTAEKGRNNKFKYQESEKSYTTDADGTKIIENDFFVTAAGGDRFKLEATDDWDNTVESHNLETHRIVYIQPIKMRTLRGVTGPNDLISTYGAHNIRIAGNLVQAMDHIDNVTSDNLTYSNFKTQARTAYNLSPGKSKEPCVVALVFIDHSAEKHSSVTVTKPNVEVGPGKPDIDILIVHLADDGETYIEWLWKGVKAGEGWFVSAKFTGRKKSDNSPVSQDIPEAKCTPVPPESRVPDACPIVKIDVKDLPEATGDIELVVDTVDYWRGGFSDRTNNVITVCTKIKWTTVSRREQSKILLHEMGHKFGLTPNDAGTGLDKSPTHYTGKGHKGPHCHFGIPAGQPIYNSSTDEAASQCCMYGQTQNIMTMCNNCKAALWRQDLSSGWSRF